MNYSKPLQCCGKSGSSPFLGSQVRNGRQVEAKQFRDGLKLQKFREGTRKGSLCLHQPLSLGPFGRIRHCINSASQVGQTSVPGADHQPPELLGAAPLKQGKTFCVQGFESIPVCPQVVPTCCCFWLHTLNILENGLWNLFFFKKKKHFFTLLKDLYGVHCG